MLPEGILFKQQDSTSSISFLSSIKSSLLLRYLKCPFRAYQVPPYSAMNTAGELHINDALCGNVFFWSFCLWRGQDDVSDKGSSCITIQYLPIQIAPKYFFKHGLHWGLISILLFLWSSVLKHQPSCATRLAYTWKHFYLAWGRIILLHGCFRSSPAQWGSGCSIFFPSTADQFSKMLFESSAEFFYVWKSLYWAKIACFVATTNKITFH